MNLVLSKASVWFRFEYIEKNIEIQIGQDTSYVAKYSNRCEDDAWHS